MLIDAQVRDGEQIWFEPSNHFVGELSFHCGDAFAASACNPFADVVTIDSASVGVADVRAIIKDIKTLEYDTLTVFAVADAPKDRQVSFECQIFSGIHKNTLCGEMPIDGVNIYSKSFSIKKHDEIDICVTIKQNPSSGEVKFRFGLYKKSELCALANQFGSDKGSIAAHSLKFCAHGYAEVYERELNSTRSLTKKILEIGLHTPTTYSGVPNEAPSLKMWQTYFDDCDIFGFDKNDFTNVAMDRVTIYRGDQSVAQDLVELSRKIGNNLDVIIDDGSHQSSHQQMTLALLFRCLKPGGLFIIEDLDWQPDPTESPSTIEFLDSLKNGSLCKIDGVDANVIKDLRLNIASIVVHRPSLSRIAVIRKSL